MTICDITLDSEKGWKNVADLISAKTETTFTFDSSKKYYFQVKNGNVLFNNNSTTPTDNSGLVAERGEQVVMLIASGNLYAQANGGKAVVNVSAED